MPVALADHDLAGSFSLVILSRSGNSWKRSQRFLSTLVEVSALILPELKVEIDVQAVLP